MSYFQNILSDSISGKTSDPEAPYNQDTSGPPLLQVNNLHSSPLGTLDNGILPYYHCASSLPFNLSAI